MSATVATERAGAARAYLRDHRRRRRPSLFAIYLTVLAALVAGIFGHHVLATIIGGGLSRSTVVTVGPAVLALTLVAAARIGVWQGPVSFSVADVSLLLTAPLATVSLVRPKLDHAMIAGALGGAALAAAGVLLAAGGPAAVGGPRVVGTVLAMAAFGALAVAAGWLVEASRRLAAGVTRAGPWPALVAAALLVSAAGAVGRAVAVWSGPWGWAVAALAGRPGWPVATALVLIAAAATCTLARRWTADARAEAFLDRAHTRSGLTAAAFTLDYRGVALIQRGAATGRRSPRNRRLPRPRSARHAILWRDGLALVRTPSRALMGALLAAAAAVETVTHPGRGLPAVLAAVALYAAATLVCEPLRVDVDQPDRSRLLLSRPFAEVLLAHCTLPAAVLSLAGGLALAGLVLAGAAGPALLAAIVSLLLGAVAVAVLCAALAARRGGRIGPDLMIRLLSVDPSSPMALLVVVWLAPWLLVCAIVVGVAAAVVGHVAGGHHSAVGLGVGLTVFMLVVAAVLRDQARRSSAPDG